MNTTLANDLLIQFCQGRSIDDLAAYQCLRRSTVEDVLRQGLLQLVRRAEADPVEPPRPALVLTDG